MLESFILLSSPIVALAIFAVLVNYLIKKIKALELDDPTGKTTGNSRN